MDLSTSTNICAFRADGGGMGFDFIIRTCAEAGYKKLDMNFCEAMRPQSRMRTGEWQKQVYELGEMADRYGIVFTQTHVPYYEVFNCNDEEKSVLFEELIRRSIIGTSMLGAKWTVTHPLTDYAAGGNMSVNKRKNIEYMNKHLETAEKYNVGLAIENMSQKKSNPIYCVNMDELCDLADSFSSPSVGVCYDFGHANLQGDDQRKNLNIIGKSRLKCLHVQDNHGIPEYDEHLMPFYGTVDWKNAMQGLRDIGYTGELTYEIQKFTQYLPDDMKHLAVKHSIEIGEKLLSYYRGEH